MKTTIKKILAVILALTILVVPTSMLKASAGATLVWPVPGHTNLTGTFSSSHQAIDISDGSIAGATVVCAMGGTVERIYLCPNNHKDYGDCSGFGTGLVIKGDDGRHYQYAHMEPGSIPSNVYYGAYVPAGAQVGRVGNTGWSYGYHLHFQIGTTGIYDGCVDPMLETYGGQNPAPVPADIGTDFYALILNTASSKPISKNTSNNNITLETENGTSLQKWHFARQSDGAYVITSCYDGKVLEMTDGIKANYTLSTAKDTFWGGYYQQWYLIPQGNGYIFLNKHYSDEQWVLDLYDNKTADGSSVEIFQRNDSNAQIWSVYAEEHIQLSASVLYATVETSTVTYYWTEVYGETSYTLKIWDNEACNGEPYKTVTSNGNSYSVSLPAGTYYAKVISYDYFNSCDSNVFKSVVEEPTTQPTTQPVTKPAEPTTKPAETTTKPAESTTKPTETTTQPVPTTTKPATQPATKPETKAESVKIIVEKNFEGTNQAKLSAEVNPSKADYKSIVWESSDTSIVTIDKDGYVTSTGVVGEATITVIVTNNDGTTVTDSIPVNVEGDTSGGILDSILSILMFILKILLLPFTLIFGDLF